MGLIRTILGKIVGKVRHVAQRDAIRRSWSAGPRSGRRLLIIGSSVAYGQGATGNPPNGWANRLTPLLEARGWEVLNRALPGDTTTGVIKRWSRDVIPCSPDIVIIALSLNNEGIMGTNPPVVYDGFVNNMAQLVRMAREAGIVPVVSSPYPNNGYDARHYRYVRQWMALLESWGVPTLNFLGGLDDGTGKYVPGTFVDDTHPNDSGHEKMFRSIPPTLFDQLLQ